MKGGDFTRLSFKPSKHYTHVLKQQGRVDLDADEIENEEIQDYLRRTEAKDIIGPCGAPSADSAFSITPSDTHDFTISPGRFYVDGILCELDSPTTYATQPYFPNPPALNPQDGNVDLVYLDVWRRHVTAVEDPDIRESALGGPDTTTRLQTIFQIKVQSNIGNVSCDSPIEGWPPATSGGRLSSKAVSSPPPENPCDFLTLEGYRGLENRLYAIEIHDPGNRGTATFKWSRDNCSIVFPIEEFTTLNNPAKIKVKRVGREQVLSLQIGDWIEVLDDKSDYTETAGTMAQIHDMDPSTSTLILDRALPVGVYRIQDHARIRRWDQTQSVDANGLLSTSGDSVQLEDGVQVSFSGTGFRTRDYWAFTARTPTASVEELQRSPPLEPVHHYCRLALIKWHSGNHWGDTEVSDCRPEFSPLTDVQRRLDALYRQWEIRYVSGDGQEGEVNQLLPGALMVGVEDALGIPVASASVTFTVTSGGGTLNQNPVFTDLHGIATCQWTLGEGSITQTVEAALTHAPQGTTLPLHFRAVASKMVSPTVTGVSWHNGQAVYPEELAYQGLSVSFSQPMNPATITLDTFIVTLEIPDMETVPSSGTAPPPPLMGHRIFVPYGVVHPDGSNTFTFTPVERDILNGMLNFWLEQEDHMTPGSAQLRCRVTLKGGTILDAEGHPLAGRISRQAGPSSTELDFPSSDGARGSDFESWFYIVPYVIEIGTINVNTASLSDLMHISGINYELAQAIIDHRPYSKLDEISKIQGIDSQTLAALKDKFIVSQVKLSAKKRSLRESKKSETRARASKIRGA